MRISGSSNIVIIDNRKIAIVHQWAIKDDTRLYFHRFVEVDNDTVIQKISFPFNFGSDEVIEYTTGILVDGDFLLVGVSIGDYSTDIRKVKLEFVLSSLKSRKEWYSDFLENHL